jgi:parallel beta-helix repeat protein
VAQKNADVCLAVPSNSTLIINGTVRLKPNYYPRCDIIRAKGNNIKISGSGSIVGDKHTHLGTDGEWGMGIRFHGAINSSVRDLTIKDCWGDCIYVGGNSKNVLIEKCKLDHGRRQGISVTKADSVTIKNCKISNVGGTNPQYAIDLEPNPNDTVNHILIENVEVANCEGGFMATIGKKNVEKKNIGKVQIKNCNVSALSNYPIRMTSCESLSVEDCIINAKNENSAIFTKNTRSVVVRNNLINVKQEILLSVKNTVKEVIGKKGFVPINVIQAEKQEIRDNKIVER